MFVIIWRQSRCITRIGSRFIIAHSTFGVKSGVNCPRPRLIFVGFYLRGISLIRLCICMKSLIVTCILLNVSLCLWWQLFMCHFVVQILRWGSCSLEMAFRKQHLKLQGVHYESAPEVYTNRRGALIYILFAVYRRVDYWRQTIWYQYLLLPLKWHKFFSK